LTSPTSVLVFDPSVSNSVRRLVAEELSKGTPKKQDNTGPGCAVGCFGTVLLLFAASLIPAHPVGAVFTVLVEVVLIVGLWRSVVRGPTSFTGRYKGRYLAAGDFDVLSRRLLERALAAVDGVTDSQVNKEGLLDTVGNDIILPQQLWEIAQLLHKQSQLRAEQSTASTSLMTDELAAVLRPQRQALDQSVAAVTRRIDQLETYALQVWAADSALEARNRLKDNDKYRELLAHTDDETAVEGLDAQALEVEATLRSSVREALAAGEALAVPQAD
jgi:hypothetical protein